MKKKTWQVVISGAGGQGLVLAGNVLGEAAAIHENLHAVQTQSYGVASRGGFSKAEVIVGEEEIAYPKVNKPDVILTLTEEAFNIALGRKEKETFILYDSSVIAYGGQDERIIGYPFEDLARELGSTAVVNMLGLGVIVHKTGVVSKESIINVLDEKYSRYPLNVTAFKKGIEISE